MKALFLAAGYATRLYPLTKDFPKPLLKVGNKTILDRLLDDLDGTSRVDSYFVVTNGKFAPIFESWAKEHKEKITIIDDHTFTNETRLGAVKDIELAIEEGKIDDDLLIAAGDNVLSESLSGFLDYAEKVQTSCTVRVYVEKEEELHRYGISEVDEEGRLLSLEEKPLHPKSHFATPPFYFYRKEDLPLIKDAIESGCGTDAPGQLVAWMCKHTPMHSYPLRGKRYDIGTLESYQEAQKIFAKE